jgi:hypothetical protein
MQDHSSFLSTLTKGGADEFSVDAVLDFGVTAMKKGDAEADRLLEDLGAFPRSGGQ